MKKNCISLLIAFFVNFTNAQELNLPVFTQYLADNDFVVSPTFAGIGDNIRIRANGLSQWVGLEGAPDNQSIYADIRVLNNSGFGIAAYNDKNGNTRQKGVRLSFAHHLTLDEGTYQFLSLGLSYNLNNFRVEIENFRPTAEIPIVDPNIIDDRTINNNNFDFGLLYRYRNLYVSFNANNLLEKNVNPFLAQEPNSLLNFQLYTGMVFKSQKNRNVEYEPSIFYQIYNGDGRSSTDVNFKYRKTTNNFGDYYWIGASYRFLNDQVLEPLNIGPMAGLKYDKFYFAYSYQATINELAGYNSGTHMITLGVDLFQNASNCACTSNYNKYFKW